MEKAAHYRADAVFFEASEDGKPRVPQAFIYRSDGPAIDESFGILHKRLWSWGGVPLVYRVTDGLVQLFRCGHRPDFERKGNIVFNPFRELDLASKIAVDPWWDYERLRNGTLWDDPQVCSDLLSRNQAAQKTIIIAVKKLHDELEASGILPKDLRRRLLVLSILIAYLEERKVFEDGFFSRFLPGAVHFFEVLADGRALVGLLDHLEERFNGHVFAISNEYRLALQRTTELSDFADLVEGKQEPSGQRTLWQRYSFADLPVELISHIYQLFVEDASVAVYTPHFLVRLALGEILTWDRLDRLETNDEVILDGACGSGIFLVEAYKRLVLHWRARNGWKRPKQTTLKHLLVSRLRGIDLDEGAVELAAFSLCLALCDALEPEEIRTSVRLFPPLKGRVVRTGCFFEVLERKKIRKKIGAVVGNPPFKSGMGTDGAERAYEEYTRLHGPLPDRQLAYLFLYVSLEMLEPGGVLALLQQYNFLYNQQSINFRRFIFESWDVREILDFVSVRGLFQRAGADTKILVVVAEAQPPPPERQVLHATFRRSGRTHAEQGFDIDYYDLHWLPRNLVLENDDVWRSDLLGGGRVLSFVNRLRELPTLGQFAAERGWDHGEGFIVGKSGRRTEAAHLTGKRLLPSTGISDEGIDRNSLTYVEDLLFKTPYTSRRFTPPMMLIREHMNLSSDVWVDGYLTYKCKIVGICGSDPSDAESLIEAEQWFREQRTILKAYASAISVRLFTQKATALSELDILSLPYTPGERLSEHAHEEIIATDIVDYYWDLVRLGDSSRAMQPPRAKDMDAYTKIVLDRVNCVYKENTLHAIDAYSWPGVICQAFRFDDRQLDSNGSNELKGRIDEMLKERRGGGVNVTRIGRFYGENSIYLVKPNRLRYWLRSVALRDSDEVLADLAQQGF